MLNCQRRRNSSTKWRWNETFKKRIVAEESEPGVTVTQIARRYDLDPRRVSNWMKKFSSGVALEPVEVTSDERGSLTSPAIEVDLPGVCLQSFKMSRHSSNASNGRTGKYQLSLRRFAGLLKDLQGLPRERYTRLSVPFFVFGLSHPFGRARSDLRTAAACHCGAHNKYTEQVICGACQTN